MIQLALFEEERVSHLYRPYMLVVRPVDSDEGGKFGLREYTALLIDSLLIGSIRGRSAGRLCFRRDPALAYPPIP